MIQNIHEDKLVSIIIPVYNIENYLPNCLNTIIHQTYKNLEIILIDDGSTDKSSEICDKYAEKDSRIIVVHQDNQKRGYVRNSGLRIAQGEYIMFVDGDDYLHLQIVELLYKAINCNREYDIAIANYLGTYNLNENIGEDITEIYGMELTTKDLLSNMSLFTHIWGNIYRKNVIDEIVFSNYQCGEDYDFNIRTFLITKKAIWIRRTLYFYVQRNESATHLSNGLLIGRECQLQALQTILDNLPEEKEEYRQYLLRELYVIMTLVLSLPKSNNEENRIATLCRKYESMNRKLYWTNKNISLLEKTKMTLNVLYPKLVRKLKFLITTLSFT